MQALVSLVAGQQGVAEEHYRRLRPLLWRPDADLRWGGVLLMLVDLADAFADTDAALELCRQLEPWSTTDGALGIHTAFFEGPVCGYYGRALASAGRSEDAEPWLRRALTASATLRSRVYAARTSCDLAELLLGRGGAPAREGQTLANEALRTSRAVGMPGTVRRAERLLARVPDPLSPREREIARLVLDALSNREIAGRLVISERTVETHVRALLGKMGCANRTELIARRTELGL
jgi:DNA-binding CsgD family transcriptional regulator